MIHNSKNTARTLKLSSEFRYSILKNIALAILASGLLLIVTTTVSRAELGDHFVMCRHNKDVRTLRVDKADANSCKAVYTKQGVDQVIGSSTMSSEGCNEFVSHVRKNLEEGRWACREVKESRLSNLNAESN